MNMFVTVADIVIVVVVAALVVYLCHLGNFVCFSFSVCLFVFFSKLAKNNFDSFATCS